MALPVVIMVGEAKKWIPDLVKKAESLKCGPYTDASSNIGPLINQGAKERVLRLIESGVKEGAKLVLDGRNPKVSGSYSH